MNLCELGLDCPYRGMRAEGSLEICTYPDTCDAADDREHTPIMERGCPLVEERSLLDCLTGAIVTENERMGAGRFLEGMEKGCAYICTGCECGEPCILVCDELSIPIGCPAGYLSEKFGWEVLE